MKNLNNYQLTKVHPQGVAKHLLDFFPFQSGVAYKSVAYKKVCIPNESQNLPTIFFLIKPLMFLWFLWTSYKIEILTSKFS